MKNQREDIHTVDGSGETENEVANVINEPVLDRDAMAELAYYCWEDRGYPNDSPEEVQGGGDTLQSTGCRCNAMPLRGRRWLRRRCKHQVRVANHATKPGHFDQPNRDLTPAPPS